MKDKKDRYKKQLCKPTTGKVEGLFTLTNRAIQIKL